MPIVLHLYGDMFLIHRGIAIVQVKEKLGGLRFYYDTDGADEHIEIQLRQVCAAAERLSYDVCEIGGSEEKVRTSTSDPRIGWIRTLCETHHQARREALEQSND